MRPVYLMRKNILPRGRGKRRCEGHSNCVQSVKRLRTTFYMDSLKAFGLGSAPIVIIAATAEKRYTNDDSNDQSGIGSRTCCGGRGYQQASI